MKTDVQQKVDEFLAVRGAGDESSKYKELHALVGGWSREEKSAVWEAIKEKVGFNFYLRTSVLNVHTNYDELTDILASGQGPSDHDWPMAHWKEKMLREFVGGLTQEERAQVSAEVGESETSPDANSEEFLGTSTWLPQEKEFILELLKGGK